MMNNKVPGKVFRELLKQNTPLQIVGCINAYQVLLQLFATHKYK